MTTVPELHTERLTLRAPEVGDFALYREHMTSADETKYMGGAQDERGAWRLFLVSAGGWMITGSGWWTVVERATGEVVGTVGAFFRETQFDRGHEADVEVGWIVFRAHRGRGFAKEAAQAALEDAFRRHAPARVIAHVDAANVASVAVCVALGMQHLGAVDFYGEPTQLYAIAPPSPATSAAAPAAP